MMAPTLLVRGLGGEGIGHGLDHDATFLARAVSLSRSRMEAELGGPFGAVMVRGGIVLAEGWKAVTFLYDELPKPPLERSMPTRHLPLPDAEATFPAWAEKTEKVRC